MSADEELHIELEKDAATLGIDEGAIREEISKRRIIETVEEAAADIWPFIEPLLVGLAQAEAGPIGAFIAREAGDALTRKLNAFSKAGK